jgi:hypothetical protein
MHELAIGQCKSHRLAEVFPELTVLNITKFGPPDPIPVEQGSCCCFIDCGFEG